MIIPLDNLKSSRGYELLGKTMTAMAIRDGYDRQPVARDTSINNLEDKFDRMVGLLETIVTQNNNPVPAYVVANQAQTELDKFQRQRNSTNILARG